MNVENFDGFSFHRVDDDIREWRKREFPCAATMARSTAIGRGYQGTNALVDCPDGWFRKLRIILLQIVFDVL
jgi:hypothetical protein